MRLTTFFALSGLLNCFASLVLGIFVFSRNRQGEVNRSYFLFNSSIAFWSAGYIFWPLSHTKESVLFWFQVLHYGALLVPVTYYHFVLTLTNRFTERRHSLAIGYLLALFLAPTIPTKFFISDMVPRFGLEFWATPGIFYHFFLLYFFSYVVMTLALLWKEAAESGGGRERVRYRYVFVATLIGYAGGSTNYPLWYGIPIYPVGNILVTLYVGIIAYAIVRHQLMDIEVIIRRTVVFAGLVGSVVAVVSMVTFVAQDVLGHYIGISQAGSNVLAAVIIAALYGRIRDGLVNVTEKYLFQKPYDYRHLLRQFTDEVITVLDLRKLVDLTVETLEKTMKIESVGLWLLNRVTNRYELTASKGMREPNLSLAESDPVVKFLQKTQEPVMRDFPRKRSKPGFEFIEEGLGKLKVEVCLPLAMRAEMVGILTMGRKKSDEPYSEEDLETLAALAKTEAVAISNALLAAEAAQKEKLAVIGTLASAINHEVCNPLNNIKVQAEGLYLQMKRGMLKELPREELEKRVSSLMQITMSEIDRAAAITTRLSNFSKPAREPVSEPVELAQVAEEVYSLLGHDLELREITLERIIPPDIPMILMDHRQLQEILFNLIRNAGQAIGQKGKVILRAERNGAGGYGRVAIHITDTGCGIPPQNLQRLFTPFFTTKGEGKGTGLGLFVIKRLVERNEGTISVTSEVGQGTTFTVEFPMAAAPARAA